MNMDIIWQYANAREHKIVSEEADALYLEILNHYRKKYASTNVDVLVGMFYGMNGSISHILNTEGPGSESLKPISVECYALAQYITERL